MQQHLSSGNGKASEDSIGEINDVCRTAEPVLVGNVSPVYTGMSVDDRWGFPYPAAFLEFGEARLGYIHSTLRVAQGLKEGIRISLYRPYRLFRS